MKKTLLVLSCAILLFSACTPQNEAQIKPNTPTQQVLTSTLEPATSTPPASETTDATDSLNVVTVTPSVTIQPTALSTSTNEALIENSTPFTTESKAIIIDHTSVALFDQIPERYLTAARDLRLMFSGRSVGQNIDNSLNCLVAPSWNQSDPGCRRDYYNSSWDWKVFEASDLANGLVPARIMFNADSSKYNRDNWTFEFRGGDWSKLTQDFIESLAPAYIDSKDVLSYHFSYLNVSDRDISIADPATGFFSDNPNKYDVYDLEAFMARYPDKIFFFWTANLARSIGSQTALSFNNQMRQYAREHNKILFDMADIESHTDQGVPCYDNRDGIEYCSQNTGECENHPDDGQELPAICQDYTTELDAGHLGSVSAGKIQITKAFWVLMARIAGWDGQSP